MSKKYGILLVNLGTPRSPSTADVRVYLKEFLLDGRVIDIPWLPRNLLVRGIIAPFRAPKSAKTYKEIWTEEGSPLLVYSERLAEKLSEKLGPEFVVSLAMRYQEPSIERGLDALRKAGVDHYIIFPLFPQYASATTGSVHQKVMDIMRRWQAIPSLTMINSYPEHPGMTGLYADLGRRYKPQEYDHILFSFHGLPERQLRKADPGDHCLKVENCCDYDNDCNRLCYRAQCVRTARAIASNLQLTTDDYTICFQSRLGRDPWIQPYTSDVLEGLAEQGKKKVLVFCPAFVADCLETIFEIGEEYDEEFVEMGGEKVQLVESLNDHPQWVDAIADILFQHIGKGAASSAFPAS